MTQPRWREWPPDIQSVLFLTVPVIPEWSFCFPTATTRFIWSARTGRGTARYQLNGDVELWNGTLSPGQSLTVPGISKYRAIYATIQGYKRVMFLSDTQSGFCGASAQGAQLSMSRLDISGDTVTFSGMTINFNPDGSVSDTVIPECTRISGYLTKITIS